MWLSPAHLGSWEPRNLGAADLSFAAIITAGSPPVQLTILTQRALGVGFISL